MSENASDPEPEVEETDDSPGGLCRFPSTDDRVRGGGRADAGVQKTSSLIPLFDRKRQYMCAIIQI